MKNYIIYIYLLLLLATTTGLSAQTIAGSINASSNTDTVTYSGSSAQAIPANLFVSNTVNNLKINNTAGVTLGGTLNLSGTLYPIAGTLATGGYLTLISTSTGTARIDEVTGSISGNVTVQRFIPAKTARRFSFVGSSVAQTIRSAWQQQLYITGAGTGGTPCGSTTGNGTLSTDKYNSNGFDVTQSDTPSMFLYNATKVNGSRFVSIANTISTSLAPGTGYSINIRGNRNSGDVTCANQLETASPTAPEAVTLSATGTVTTGNVTVSLNNPSTHPYTLLANPYPSPISFSAFQANNSNTYNKMWTFSPFGNGNYTTYSAGVIANGATGYDNTSGNYIASGQAFFVEASTSGSITFQESHKSAGTIPNNQYFGAANNKLIRVGLKTNTNSPLDEVVIRFNNNGTKAYNHNWDAASFNTASQVLTTLKDTFALAISTLPDSLAADTALLGFSSSTTGTFHLVFSDYQGMDSSVSIILKDNFFGINQNIRTNQTYNFNVTSDTASQGNKRFEIIFNGGSNLAVNSIDASATMVGNAAIITWNTVGEKGESYYAVEKSIDGKTFIQIGQETAKNTATASYNFTDNNPSAIDYYRIKATSATGTLTYSNITKLTTHNSQLTACNLYPNPLVGKVLNVQLTNIPAGKYDISIYNALGQKVNEQSITHSGGTGSYGLTINTNLTSGTYLVYISDAVSKAMVYQGKLMVR